MGYRKVYFRISSGYLWGNDWSSSEEQAAFREETRRLFQDDGWTLETHKNAAVCDTVRKGLQDLYLHPMNFSGVILEETIPHLEELLAQAHTFRCRGVDRYEVYLDLTDEDYWAMLESQRREIEADILNRCRTKRRNLCITGPVIENVAHKFSVARLCDKDGNRDLTGYFVKQVMDELIAKGRLATAKTKRGDGWRTVTEKELHRQAAG